MGTHNEWQARMQPAFFWLHVKKSAGISTRQLLEPHYLTVDRGNRPECFLQADQSAWNDILNNYRMVLGNYQFRRSLFAKTYLYPDTWDDMVSFAFAREPVSRCVSMFYYLFWETGMRGLRKHLDVFMRLRRVPVTTGRAFDLFLDVLEEAPRSPTNLRPISLHFTTHTAPMWGDVADDDGNVLLTRIYRLENLNRGIDEVYEMCGLPPREVAARDNVVVNRTRRKGGYRPSPAQRRRIEQIFAKDFDLYENAL